MFFCVCRLQEVEAGIEPDRPSIMHTTPQSEPPPPAPILVESTSVYPQPLRALSSPIPSPIAPIPQAKPDIRDLETKLKLESRIIELQGSNKTESSARKKLEKHVAKLEESKTEDMDAICQLEQCVHDLQENNELYKERVSQLLATPPLVFKLYIIQYILHYIFNIILIADQDS